MGDLVGHYVTVADPRIDGTLLFVDKHKLLVEYDQAKVLHSLLRRKAFKSWVQARIVIKIRVYKPRSDFLARRPSPTWAAGNQF